MILTSRIRTGLLLLAVVGIVFLRPGLALAGGQIPLKGEFEGVGNDFAGRMTHLGRFTGVFDPTTASAEWTAANGDTVTNQTTSFVFVEQLGPTLFRYEQTLVITGGTGRFAGATGSATVTGVYDLGTLAYDGQLEGTMSRVGRGK
jgi:hypothetical protein